MEPISKIFCDGCRKHFTYEINATLRNEDLLPEGAVVNHLNINGKLAARVQEKVQRVHFDCPHCKTRQGGHIDIMSDMAFDYVFADWIKV